MMRIRLLLLFIVAIVSLAFGAHLQPVLAQTGKEPGGFREVTLWLNPEYDDPRLLVMLEGKITDANAPVMVRFLVPAAAEMYSAGSKDAQGKYSGGPPKRVASQIPGWDEISYELKTDTFRVEYYDPVIVGRADKEISYDFRWLYPISDLTVIVQQPRTATNFTVTPKGTTDKDGEGFTVQTFSYSDLAVTDPPLHFDIAYTKSDPSPSIKSPPLNVPAEGSPNWGLILVVITIIVTFGGFLWVLKSSQERRGAPRYASRNQPVRSYKGKRHKARFCSQCGSAIDISSRFCSNCGKKSRD